MAVRRQRLSQRRKAVGMTQESFAQRLGVERSTVARWEAGDTEPLPSIRPNVARALQVSIDQLAELLTESDNATTTRALSADTEATIPMLLPEVQTEVWLGRAEFEDLIRPQVAETVEELRSASVGPEDLDARHAADINVADAGIRPDTPVPTTVKAGGFAGSDVPKRAQADVPDLSSVSTIPLDIGTPYLQWRRARSRRVKRFAAAGFLALVGGAASVPLITSHSDPIPPAATGNAAPAAPVAAIPAPDPGSGPLSQGSTGAPIAAPNKPADSPARSGAATVRTSHTTRSDHRSTSQSKPPASMRMPPPPRNPAIPAEAYMWSHEAASSAHDQSRAYLRPGPQPRP
ncbi:MAG: XRE family transcriptional regulator [Actinomycetota bacterium]|nr:XRE family transcriptional regulator [Actinomycetota bacterium]